MMEEKTLCILLSLIVLSKAIKPEKLPLCPTNIEYFPQNLPMHCRMPRSTDFNEGGAGAGATPGVPPGQPPSPFYQSPPSDKQPSPVPIPIPPGLLPYPFPVGPPGGPIPMPMPMPMPVPGPSHKLPVIVMPFYSPDPSYKKPRQDQPKRHNQGRGRRPRRPNRPRRPRPRLTDSDTSSSTDTDTDRDLYTDSSETDTTSDTSTDTSSDTSGIPERGWWNYHGKRAAKKSGRRSSKKHTHKSKRKHKQSKRELLTPVLQYVTKDGYVIFEKKISKGEAKDWLKMRNEDPDPNKDEIDDGANDNNPRGNKDIVEPKENDKNEDDEKSVETLKLMEEATTEKSSPRLHKKHRIKPNLLLPSAGKN